MPRRPVRVPNFPPPVETASTCALCQREVPAHLITLHHLKPREKGGTAEHRTPLCKPCHKQIHATYGNTDLARAFDTLDALREAPLLQPFLRWIRKQSPDRNFKTIRAKDHPHQGKRRY